MILSRHVSHYLITYYLPSGTSSPYYLPTGYITYCTTYSSLPFQLPIKPNNLPPTLRYLLLDKLFFVLLVLVLCQHSFLFSKNMFTRDSYVEETFFFFDSALSYESYIFCTVNNLVTRYFVSEIAHQAFRTWAFFPLAHPYC